VTTIPPRPRLLTSEALPPRASQARSRAKREKLLAAGLELFRQKGYEAASVEEISARAEVAVGGFYQHFANKRQLLVTLMDKLLESLSQLDLRPKPATKDGSQEAGGGRRDSGLGIRGSTSLTALSPAADGSKGDSGLGIRDSGGGESPIQPGSAEDEIPDESEYPASAEITARQGGAATEGPSSAQASPTSPEPGSDAAKASLPAQLKPHGIRAALYALLLGAFSRELPYAGAYRAWKEAVLTDAELARMQVEIERWTTARVTTVFELLVQLPGARKNVNVPVLARLMDRFFWDLLGQALALPTPELRAVLATTVDLVYHTLFMDL
jgi:AcrR family transcriptional regulator